MKRWWPGFRNGGRSKAQFKAFEKLRRQLPCAVFWAIEQTWRLHPALIPKSCPSKS